jgi:hypothetical protein
MSADYRSLVNGELPTMGKNLGLTTSPSPPNLSLQERKVSDCCLMPTQQFFSYMME